MEMVVIAFVAVAAFAVVLVPLFRRGTRTGADDREFATDDLPRPAVEQPLVPMAAGPATPLAPVAASVLADTDSGHAALPDDEIEREVLRYRAALRAGTVCARCGQANPAASAFCFDCGRKLPLADAREFE